MRNKHRLRFDASIRNGKRGIGFVIYDPDEEIIYKHYEEVKQQYNTLQLEMYAMFRCLREAQKRSLKHVKVRGDNLFALKIIRGKHHDKNVQFLPSFEYINFSWIPRKINHDADVLSKMATAK